MTEAPLVVPIQALPPIQPSAGERIALRILQAGAIAVVLAVSTFNAFELDRFFVPKELALHIAAVLAAMFAMPAMSRVRITKIDLYLLAFLALGIASGALATNRWVALRAFAISASSVLLFWTGRALHEAGLSRPLLRALAFAVVLAAVTSLLQAYGIETTLFSENRSPGGTLGNRNFVAHVAAFGFPLLLFAAFTARRAFFMAGAGVTIVTAALVLTRSRAAWLAFAAVIVVTFLALIASPSVRRSGRTWGRAFVLIAFLAGGIAAALFIPNTLRWRSENPYLESVQRVADYEGGSGRGRLVQYERSLLMAARHPVLGVGPGNWPVVYPRHAARNDPSLNDSEPGMTYNPWPSSDWIAWISERGFAAAIILALAFLFMVFNALRQLRIAEDVDHALAATALLGTIAGAVVSGLFDAVLLLGLPAFLVWSALGALWRGDPLDPRRVPRIAAIALIAVAAIGAARSAAQLASMGIYVTRSDRASLSRAAAIDPGNYRLQLRLARMGGRQRCDHARAAHRLFPHADAADAASRNCGE